MASKKVMAIFMALTMVASLIICTPIASMAAENTLTVEDVEFTKDGETIYTICDGNIGANIYMSNNSANAETVYASVTRYEGNRLSDISFIQKTVPAKSVRTKVSVAPIATTVANGYNVLLWDDNMNPISNNIALTDKSTVKKITKFQVGIGTYTYNADINEETKEITIFVPTRYMANDTSVGYVEKIAQDHGLANTKANLYGAISAGITPVIEGMGTISGVGEAKDFSKPVEYKVTAEDGSSVVYTAKIIENDSKMFHKSGTASLTSNGLPHPRDGWRVKNSGQAEPNGNYAWFDAAGHTAQTSSKVTVEGVANQVFRLVKTDATKNDTFYTYSPNKPDAWGYQQTQIAEVTMSLSNLTEGDGFAISYFEKEGYANKNANLIFKKVSGENKMEIYWSRGGVGNPTKIDTVAPISLDELHTYRVVRTMNPERLSTGKYAGNIALYVDGKYAFSVTEKNYLSFNGIENGSDHNGAYTMMMFGSVTNDTAANGGVTYTLTLDEIKYQTVLYGEDVTGASAEIGDITIAGKTYKHLYKDGVYTYIVPADADLSGVTPTVIPGSKYVTVTSVEGSLSDEAGMTITATNSLTGAVATYVAKADKMTHLMTADFSGETFETAAPEGFSLETCADPANSNQMAAKLVADPTDSSNKVIEFTKVTRNWMYFAINANTPITKTNGYSVSFKTMLKDISGGHVNDATKRSIVAIYTVANNSKNMPVFDVAANGTASGFMGYRLSRERIGGGTWDFDPLKIVQDDNGSNMTMEPGKWYDVTYTVNFTDDTENYPNGHYYDLYINGIHKYRYTGGVAAGNGNAPIAVTDDYKGIVRPLWVNNYGNFESLGKVYFDDVEVYYYPAQ